MSAGCIIHFEAMDPQTKTSLYFNRKPSPKLGNDMAVNIQFNMALSIYYVVLPVIVLGTFCWQKPFSHVPSSMTPCYLYVCGKLCGHVDVNFSILSFGNNQHALGFHIKMFLTSYMYFTCQENTQMSKADGKTRHSPLPPLTHDPETPPSKLYTEKPHTLKGHEHQQSAFRLEAELQRGISCLSVCAARALRKDI